MASVWAGRLAASPVPTMPEGCTSFTPPLTITAISRLLIQGIAEASSPAASRAPSHGPNFARRPTARADPKHIAAADFHARVFFPSLQIFGIDVRTGLQIRHSFEQRQVYQNAERVDRAHPVD